MQWAEGGSLDDFIRGRLGVTPDGKVDTEDHQSRSARIRAFRSAQAHPEQHRVQHSEKQRVERGRAVHLLSAEEVKSIFNDVVLGLGFLVSVGTDTWINHGQRQDGNSIPGPYCILISNQGMYY